MAALLLGLRAQGDNPRIELYYNEEPNIAGNNEEEEDKVQDKKSDSSACPVAFTKEVGIWTQVRSTNRQQVSSSRKP